MQGETDDECYGTLAYCSPEILLGNRHTLKTDVWSMGVVLYVLLSGKFPYLSECKKTTKNKITSGQLPKFDKAQWDRISEEAKDLVTKMLSSDEDCRIDASQLLDHDWFYID